MTSEDTLWRPTAEQVEASNLTRYLRWLESKRNLRFAGYSELWRWSVTDLEAFWGSIADFFDVRFRTPPERVIADRVMPGASWFPGARLNYSEHALAREGDAPALICRGERGNRREFSRDDLRREVAAARAGLRQLGIGAGDRVAAYLPNDAEAVIAFLATASLGAIWSSCPPEFGVESVLDRFRQIEPKVLIGVDRYDYNGRAYDRSNDLARIISSLPTLSAAVVVRAASGTDASPRRLSWQELTAESAELVFDPMPFDHPLWILYSSGTTGLPKAIVQGHGGILVEHLKQLALHTDLGAEDRFSWYTTTGWMMWNYLVSGLLLGTTVVLYDGSPGWPDLNALYRLADEEAVTCFGVSAPFLMACRAAGLEPGRQFDFEALRAVGSTGAPLPAEGFDWVVEHVKSDVWLGSLSGGTDVCTGFVGPSPLQPVRRGRVQCRSLGARVEAFDEDGHAVTGQVGELVLTEPLPSMPLFFWNDDSGERYRNSYFDHWPGVWRHGDWIEIDEDGSSVIYGRSDSTLNRGGVRMGTSEFYRAAAELAEVEDCVIVDTGSLDREGKLWLFVVLAEGVALDAALAGRIRRHLRTRLSPRHGPDEIRAIPEIPTTLSGKKLEVPIKRILAGEPVETAVNVGTLKNPESIAALVAAL
ncbi:MAG: acetoacetate--CoA ligase [Acidobacteriota bacterium]|nr:acetoacetate--CoA ligase [Acidobacteriota bacterium]MDE3263811.1 acetoacetate--CoA ligase [Acidobacteriota bacterium]